MIAIPAEIQTLLKSKAQVGNRRPTGTVTIENAPKGTTHGYVTRAVRMNNEYDVNADQTTYGYGFYGGHWSNGFICELPSKKVLVSYRNTSTGIHYLSLVADFETLLGGNNRCAIAEYQFSAANGSPSQQIPFVSPADGEVYLLDIQSAVCPSVPCEINLYKSPDKGLSQTWDWQSLLYTSTLTLNNGFNTAGNSNILINGDDILVPFMGLNQYSGYGWGELNMLYSRDGGVTWDVSLIWYSTALSGSAYFGSSPSIFKSGGTYYLTWHTLIYNGSMLFATSTDLINWTVTNRGVGALGGDWTVSSALNMYYLADSNFMYLIAQTTKDGAGVTYIRPAYPTLTSVDDLLDYSKWAIATPEEVPWSREYDDYYLRLYLSPDEKYHIVLEQTIFGGCAAFIISGFESEPIPVPPKSLTIDRSKGAASQATIVLDNKLGIYAPDSIGAWNHIIWPNKKVEVTLGYGDKQPLVFTGLIDKIRMSSYPAELTITARDYSKLVLDQQPQELIGGVMTYSFTYWDRTPEYIFADLAIQAGFAVDKIHTYVTGLTFEKFLTGHESMADSYQRICEYVGGEWFCDEYGHIYFRKAINPEGSSVYAFTEGVDIFSIDYTISDEELFRNIVVWTSDANGSTIKASGVWPAADYNNILPKKTLIINAGDLVTDAAGCAAIVAAESAAITPKVREVNFVAVGNPYLQIGDVIQVTETTTTISEYYRIFEMTHKLNMTGAPIFATTLKAYHFSAPS